VPRFKNWAEGEARVKAEIVSPQGAKLDYYMPHLTAMAGEAVVVLLSRISAGLPVRVVWNDTKERIEKEVQA